MFALHSRLLQPIAMHGHDIAVAQGVCATVLRAERAGTVGQYPLPPGAPRGVHHTASTLQNTKFSEERQNYELYKTQTLVQRKVGRELNTKLHIIIKHKHAPCCFKYKIRIFCAHA